MIVEVLGEGRFRVDDELRGFNAAHARLLVATEDEDAARFTETLSELLAMVRENGVAVPADVRREPDVVLPAAGADLVEIRARLLDGAAPAD